MKKPSPRPQPAPTKGHSPAKSASNGTYWLYGQHAVLAALGNEERVIRRATFSKSALTGTENLFKKRRLQAEIVDGGFFDKILPSDAVHQGMALQVMPLKALDIEDILDEAAQDGQKRPILVLDQVTDPHNIGAILRSAAAFGARCVVVTRHHAPEETAVMAKSASGALEIVPYVQVGNLVQAIDKIKKRGFWVAGMDGEAKVTLKQAKLAGDTCLIMGAEGKGLRRLTAEHCDLLVKLPMSNAMESLNVSNAAAITLYELFSA